MVTISQPSEDQLICQSVSSKTGGPVEWRGAGWKKSRKSQLRQVSSVIWVWKNFRFKAFIYTKVMCTVNITKLVLLETKSTTENKPGENSPRTKVFVYELSSTPKQTPKQHRLIASVCWRACKIVKFITVPSFTYTGDHSQSNHPSIHSNVAFKFGKLFM